MLAIIIAWIVISFVLLSFGDIFISIYNKLCKQKEEYNIPDTFILGMCFILVPLSLSSLWLPSNHYILSIYIIICIFYWCCNTTKRRHYIDKIKNTFSTFTRFQFICILLSIIAVLGIIVWCSTFFDAAYYHYQNIRWNEEFAVVPGLGNLEDRFAFNSNYMLLSAIFTFRFLFNEPIYAFQSILFIYVMFWIISELIKSEFKISRIILLLIFFLFFSINIDGLSDSSTDIIPNICAFYFIVRFVLYPEELNKKLLFAIIIPVCLVTFKLSIFPLCLISLFSLVFLIKQKNNISVTFTILISFFLIGLWLTRNVIISGYLIYPMPEIDLFSFDWKMPEAVAALQRQYIHTYAKGLLEDSVTFGFFFRSGNPLNFKMFLINNIIVVCLYIIIAVSPFIIAYKAIKKKKIEKNLLIIYITAFICMIYWWISAPDFRFATGIILSIVFLTIYIVIRNWDRTVITLGKAALLSFTVLLLVIAINRSYNYYRLLQSLAENGGKAISSVIFTPYSFKDQAKVKDIPSGFTLYTIGEITIYLTHDQHGRGFDKLPSTVDIGDIVVQKNKKIQNVKTIEPRGSSLQNGFRTKQSCIDTINIEAEKLLH